MRLFPSPVLSTFSTEVEQEKKREYCMSALPEQELGRFSLGIQSDQAPTKPVPRAMQQAGFTVE